MGRRDAPDGSDDPLDGLTERELLEIALPAVRRTVARLLRGGQEFDDAVQTALLAVVQSAPSFRRDCRLELWVFRITVRTTLRLLKKQRSLVPQDDLELTAPPEMPSRQDALPKDLPRYLEALPEVQRQAFVLRVAHDFSVDDIARATQSSPNTVKYRIKKARAELRRMLRQDWVATMPRQH